jgi:putative long chain acyl-CoA synthase
MSTRAKGRRGGRGGVREPPLRRVAMAAQNALEIMRLGRLSSRYGAPFEVVHEGRHYRLRHYEDAGLPHAEPTGPLLLVPPLMVASEVYDIAPDVSAVGALLREGVDVWLTDFGAPEREAGGLERTLDDHVRAVSEAVDIIRARTDRDVHLAGYSQGGMFVYQVTALRRSEGIASVITCGSPVDIHRSVPSLGDRITEPLIGALHAALALPLDRIHSLPGALTSTGFKLLSAGRELGQLFDFVRVLHDRQALEKRESKRLFLRGEGFVAWPGPALRTFIDEVVVANRMSVGGFVIDGRTVTLADIERPILYFVGERDEMARPEAVRGISRAAPRAEAYEVRVRAGHFGLVVGSTAQRVTWPTVAAWLRWQRGHGRRPELLADPSAEAPAPAALGDELEGALEDLHFDLALAADVAGKAASTALAWAGDVAENLAESLTQLRWQVPRLHRLRDIRPDTRISMAGELARQAARIGDKTFFLWRGRAFSYEVASRRVDHVVRGLWACGVRPGDRVAVLMGARPSFLSIVCAVNRLGGVSVLLSPEADDEALRRGLELGEARSLLVDPDRLGRARALFAGPILVLGGGAKRPAPSGDVIDMERINPEAVKLPEDYEPNPGRAAELALILVSAGRGGHVRAAHVTNHRWAFSALGAAAACTLSPSDTVYCCLPLYHAAGGMVAAGSALVSGARLALTERFAPEPFWTEVRRYGATVVYYAGEMCRELVLAPRRRDEANSPIRLWAGSGMRADLWARMLDRFGPAGVLEFYASTETNAVLANASGRKPGAVGRPLPGSRRLELAAYDPDLGDFVRGADGRCARASTGRPGMLLARLDPQTLATAPAERIAREVFEPGDAWFVTGDLLRRDADGDYWYEERVRDVIAARGGAVFPRPIEDRLYRLPGVARVVVYGVPGEGAERVEAAVQLASGVSLAPEAVAPVLEGLPSRAWPDTIRQLDAIPITEGFRPLREPIRRAARAGTLEQARRLCLDGSRYHRVAARETA